MYQEEGQSQVRQSQAGQQKRGTCLLRITAIGHGREALLSAVKLLEAARIAGYPVWKLSDHHGSFSTTAFGDVRGFYSIGAYMRRSYSKR